MVDPVTAKGLIHFLIRAKRALLMMPRTKVMMGVPQTLSTVMADPATKKIPHRFQMLMKKALQIRLEVRTATSLLVDQMNILMTSRTNEMARRTLFIQGGKF